MRSMIDQNAEIEEELADLSQNPIRQLRQRWRAVFRTQPPAAGATAIPATTPRRDNFDCNASTPIHWPTLSRVHMPAPAGRVVI